MTWKTEKSNLTFIFDSDKIEELIISLNSSSLKRLAGRLTNHKNKVL